ncbi:MAG TPA: APC family permease, partial [Acetobacteraceae bacterium]|nr:APC family permease [Acetobacteraceae bacterium]
RAGAVIALPKLSHGRLLATVMSWIVLLGYLTSAPAEATAVVTYANNYLPGLVGTAGTLSHEGFLVAAGLLLAFALINTMAIRLVLRVNAWVTIWKLAIPVLTILAFLAARFHPANFTAHGFAPQGITGIFSAVATSGVIYAYTGFRQAVELAGESANPRRDLPVAIIGSVLAGFLIYAGLQIAFIGALRPGDLAHGWNGLHFTGVSGPFAGLATVIGMSWLAVLLYIDSAISPAGTAIIAFTSTPRLFFAAGHEGLVRGPFARVSRAGVPIIGVAITFLVGVVFLLPLPSWRAIIKVVSAAALLSYGMASVSLVTLRRTMPPEQYPRPFRLIFGVPVAALSFIVANFIIVWTGARTADVILGYVLVVAILYGTWQAVRHRGLGHLEWRGAWWLAPYYGGMWLLANIGPQALTHGNGLLSNLGLSVLLVAFSLAILAIAARSGLPDPREAKASLQSTST